MAWNDLAKLWHDTTVDYCDVCGNLLIARFWGFVSAATGESKRCCDERCERLYYRLREIDGNAQAVPGGISGDQAEAKPR